MKEDDLAYSPSHVETHFYLFSVTSVVPIASALPVALHLCKDEDTNDPAVPPTFSPLLPPKTTLDHISS